ncbi:MAG: hypothetical protein HC837_18275 [Chloroflexaceae bacterium]|nr:hypothetical protein [Chloroflexaceae bacterium]
MLYAAWCHPYGIAAFNPLLGGGAAGARTFAVGWGEGLEQVADWINQQDDSTGVVTAAIMTPSINPYLRYGAQATTPLDANLPAKTGYVVVYIYQTQGLLFPPFDRFYPDMLPVHTVSVLGLPYAWIYQVPPPVASQRNAMFGDAVQLRGFDRSAAVHAGTPLRYKLFWYTPLAPTEDYWLFAHVVGADGTRYAQVDLPYPTASWSARRYTTTELPIDLPADLPAGSYDILIGLYRPESGERLAVQTADAEQTAHGDQTLLLDRLIIK